MAYNKACKVASIVYFILISISFSLLAYGDGITIKDSTNNCPRSCICKDEEVRCTQLKYDEDISLPEGTKAL